MQSDGDATFSCTGTKKYTDASDATVIAASVRTLGIDAMSQLILPWAIPSKPTVEELVFAASEELRAFDVLQSLAARMAEKKARGLSRD